MKKKTETIITPLARTRLHEEIFKILQRKILNGDFKPGKKLPAERDMAESFNVNRITLRAALNKLESMELVEIKHGDGVYVKDLMESGSLDLVKGIIFHDGKIDFGVLMNLIELRRLLLPEMAYLAASNRTDGHIEEMRRVIFDDSDTPTWEVDRRVHAIIAKATGNILFLILLNSFYKMTRDVMNVYFEDEKNARYSREFHKIIFEAIRGKQADLTKKIMKETMLEAEARFLKIYKASKRGESRNETIC